MATQLRTEPLQFDLALLEQDPDAIHGYHQEIQHRIAYLLPPLRETLRLPELATLHARLSERASALGVATLRPDSLLLLAQLFREEGLDMAEHLFGPHLATLHAGEKQALLPGGVHVQKTVSLLLGGRLILVTRIGDHVLGRAERFAIAANLGLSRKEARQATLNPPGCIAEQAFGLLRGTVSPFLPVGFGTDLCAVVQLPWRQAWEDEGQSVAISLSPCESLLIPLRCYHRMLHRYVHWSIPDVPLVELNVGDEMRLPSDHKGGIAQHLGTLCKTSEALGRSSRKEQETWASHHSLKIPPLSN
jgi:hypothetical protein